MSWLRALPWLIAALGLVVGGGGALWYRSEYHKQVAAREAGRTAAEKAAREALAQAQARSDTIIVEQAQRIAEIAQRANTVRERIIYAPVTNVCATSPAVRAALGGLQSRSRPSDGGDPKAGGDTPAAVPGPAGR